MTAPDHTDRILPADPLLADLEGEAHDLAHVARAVAAVRAGELVALPTETVYGLAADAHNDDALLKVFAAKGRPLGHPLIVHVDGPGALDDWSDAVPAAARRLAEAFWPGPLTLVLPRAAHVSHVATGGHETVALRMPDHPLTLAVLRALGPGHGLAAPSANRFGRVSPTTADHVRDEFAGEDLLVLDGGPSSVGIESSIVDLTTDPARILRPGAITAEQLAAVAGIEVAAHDAPAASTDAAAAAAPGTLAAHYAPLARVTLVDEGADVPGLLARALAEPPTLVWARAGSPLALAAGAAAVTGPPEQSVELVTMSTDAEVVARELYATLRRADELGTRHLLVDLPAGGDIAIAIRDRLSRAATGSGGGGEQSNEL